MMKPIQIAEGDLLIKDLKVGGCCTINLGVRSRCKSNRKFKIRCYLRYVDNLYSGTFDPATNPIKHSCC